MSFKRWLKAPFQKAVGSPAVAVEALPVPTGRQKQAIDFAALCERWEHLAPRDATVAAFIDWLVSINSEGVWEQSELWEYYEDICQLTHAVIMPRKFFGKSLLAHGCKRWRAELIVDGKRRQPLLVEIRARPRRPAIVKRGHERVAEARFYGISSGLPLTVINGGKASLRAGIQRQEVMAVAV